MSDAQKLKDAVSEYDKAQKAMDEKLKTIAENQEKTQQVQAEQQSRPT